ncbi:MAG: transcription termination/antitermination protein NusG [Candidatus Omnitrophota bacterium]
MAKQWYVVHAQTGQEEKVKANIENRLEDDICKEYIFNLLVPTEKVSEVRAGKKKITERKFFPGYVLIEMELNDHTWYFIKNTPGVSGFIGTKTKPFILKEEEVKNILKQAEERKEKPTPKVIFKKGEAVKINNGPFVNFTGEIEEINPAKQKLKVMVSIFGRATPVELEYWQVEKL